MFRNVYCAKYCIVVNLLLTLNITGWNRVGPLFGNLDTDGRLIVADHTDNVQVDTQIHKVWFSTGATEAADAAGAAESRSRRVNYSASQLGTQSERIFDALGLYDVSSHVKFITRGSFSLSLSPVSPPPLSFFLFCDLYYPEIALRPHLAGRIYRMGCAMRGRDDRSDRNCWLECRIELRMGQVSPCREISEINERILICLLCIFVMQILFSGSPKAEFI